MEHLVFRLKSTEKVLLNQYLVLCAEHNPKKFMEFLNAKATRDYEFDLLSVLQMTEEMKLQEASIRILCRMGLYEEAVDRAVVHNLQLAEEIAKDPVHEDAMRKKLWIKIAEKVVSNGGTFTKLVKENDSVAVPDLLPLLPDFQTISLLKMSICSSLKEYTSVLEELKEEMRESADNLDEIRIDLKQSRTECVNVSRGSTCFNCRKNIFTAPFRAFACQHLFHENCLTVGCDECPLCGNEIISSIGETLPADNSLWN